MAFLSACIAQPCYGWLPLSDAYGIILIPIVCQKKEQKVEKEIECYDGGARPEQREGHGSKKIFFFFCVKPVSTIFFNKLRTRTLFILIKKNISLFSFKIIYL